MPRNFHPFLCTINGFLKGGSGPPSLSPKHLSSLVLAQPFMLVAFPPQPQLLLTMRVPQLSSFTKDRTYCSTCDTLSVKLMAGEG